MTTPPILEVDSLSLTFGAVKAFTDVSFSVAENELFAIIGPNGAGKTSLFNVLSRVYPPAGGRVRYRGTDLLELRTDRIAAVGIARTFQNLGLFNYLTVLENVLLGRHHMMHAGSLRGGLYWGFAQREETLHRRAAMEALDFVGAAQHAAVPVGILPYGIRKRIELARALAMEPRLLLLDEPVAGMSEEERSDVTALVRRLHVKRGLTVLLVEHDMGMVMKVAQRILVLDFGRVIALGSPAAVQRDEAVINAYLGETPGEAAEATA